MKILVTGAHFTPAVATIEQLKKFDNVEIVYVGRKTTLEGDNTPSVESKILTSLSVKFIPIIAGRLQRSITLYTIPSLFKIPIGFLQSISILIKEKPDVILSFGGYVAVPLVIVGWFFSIPIIIHEQGLVPGLANRISSIFADKIAVAFKESGFNGEKVILTGNPIRSEVIKVPEGVKLSHPRGGLPTVLIMGGNQGSHAINLAVEECLERLVKGAKVIHQTGDSKYGDFERLEGLRRLGGLRERYHATKWIGEEYAKVLKEADLVVCRAGINTLTELALSGKPALLIPIPNKEQNKNAKFFENIGLARIISQSELSGETLLNEIFLIFQNLKFLKQKANKAKEILVPDASNKLALETMLVRKR